MNTVISVQATVEPQKETIVDVTVPSLPAAALPPPPGPATRLKIAGSQPGVQVFIDGAHRGSLPLDLKDIAPGTYRIRLEAGERYKTLEMPIEIRPGESTNLGEIRLKVVKGLVTFDLVTPGARVMLVKTGASGVNQWRAIETWNKPSAKVDLEGEGWKVLAIKGGYRDFLREISFEDGLAEKTIRIELSEASAPARSPSSAARPR
jgi:serine/threonine-protein kinase